MRPAKTESDNDVFLRRFDGKKPETLLALLSEYATQTRHVDNQIWSIGQVFIPLSLSGIALGIDNAYRTLGIAIFSSILIWIWYLISERLRHRRDKAKHIYQFIETKLLKLDERPSNPGLDNLRSKSKRHGLIKFEYLSIHQLILGIALSVTAAWTALSVISFLIP